MNSLQDSYRAVADRWRRLDRWSAPSVGEALRITSLREWDERIVAPRHGYTNVYDYYARESACHILSSIERPTLMLVADSDPMVPLHTLVEAMETRSASVQLRCLSAGGHLGFPTSVHPIVEDQVLDFLLAATDASS